MVLKVVDALFLGGYKIEIKFSDGKSGIVDFEDDIRYTPGFQALKHPAAFRNFKVNSGALDWENNAINVSPEILHSRAIEKVRITPKPRALYLEALAK